MNEYRQKAINHLKTHLGCVGYRDYLIAELEKLEKIEQTKTDISVLLEAEKQKDGTYTDVGKGIAIALGLINNEIGE